MEDCKPKMKWYQKALWGLCVASIAGFFVLTVLHFLDLYQYAKYFMFFSITLAWLFKSGAEFKKESGWCWFSLIFFGIMTVIYVLLFCALLK